MDTDQPGLFSVTELDSPVEQGYRGPAACQIVGITYRQLDYWAPTGLVESSIQAAAGTGTQRLYSFADMVVLKVVERLLDVGVSLHSIRAAVEHLRARGVRHLSQVTLISDGTSIYECVDQDEIVDLLRGGQGVFGIALGGAMRDVLGRLAALPSITQQPGPTMVIGLPAHRGRLSRAAFTDSPSSRVHRPA